MTVRFLLSAFILLAAPAALAASVVPGQPGADVASAAAPARTTQTPRKIERPRQGTPLAPRVIEAPGAALMVIPASYERILPGPFSPL